MAAVFGKGGQAAVGVAEADIEAFWADGAIALRGVVDAGWRRVLAEAIEADIADPGPFFHDPLVLAA